MTLPVSIIEARTQLRLEPDDYSRDTELTGWLSDAAAWVEAYTGVLLEQGAVEQTFDAFDDIELSAWPIAPDAVVSIAYTDASGASVALNSARLDLSRRPARLWPAIGTRWPAITAGTSLTVTVPAGYATPGAMPRRIRGAVRTAILLLLTGFNEGTIEDQQAAARKFCSFMRLRTL